MPLVELELLGMCIHSGTSSRSSWQNASYVNSPRRRNETNSYRRYVAQFTRMSSGPGDIPPPILSAYLRSCYGAKAGKAKGDVFSVSLLLMSIPCSRMRFSAGRDWGFRELDMG